MFFIKEVLQKVKRDVEDGNMSAVEDLIEGLLEDGEEAIGEYLEEGEE